MVRLNNKVWSSRLESYATLDTDDGIANVDIATNAVRTCNGVKRVDSLNWVRVSFSVDSLQLALLEG